MEANMDMEQIGKMVELEIRNGCKAMKAGNQGGYDFHTARVSGMLDMIELMFGKEQREHISKEATIRLRELQIRGAI